MMTRGSRARARVATAGVVLAILALAAPSLVAAADVTVDAIPGGGWIQGPDNTAGRSAVIATSPAAGLGTSSVELITTTADTDFVGIGRAIAGPLSDVTAGSWMTYATGTSGLLSGEPASLKFGMYRLGGVSEFTTMAVERVYNATVTAGVWQTTTLSDTTLVYQTNTAGSFCLVAAPCTFAAFKAQYPDATVLGLQVAIGKGIPPTTSYVDGVSLTVDGATDTWDFELAAAPPSSAPSSGPTAPSAALTAPPTDVVVSATDPGSFDARLFIIIGMVSLIALVSASMRRSRPTL